MHEYNILHVAYFFYHKYQLFLAEKSVKKIILVVILFNLKYEEYFNFYIKRTHTNGNCIDFKDFKK